MKYRYSFYLIFSVFILISNFSYGQSDSVINKKSYKAWINTLYKPHTHNGILYDVRDSTIRLLKSRYSLNDENKGVIIKELESFNGYSINFIKLRKKGNVGKGMLIGGISGCVVSTILEIILNQYGSANSFITILNYGYIMGAGIGLGALFGSLKITIPINLDQNLFNKNIKRLNSYSKIIKN